MLALARASPNYARASYREFQPAAVENSVINPAFLLRFAYGMQQRLLDRGFGVLFLAKT